VVRRRRFTIALIASVLVVTAAPVARAASVVFNGDPTNPGTGQPYEILPGQPLVTPGADGRLGTADDVVDASVIGDIDLVVRLGAVTADGTIPPPAAMRNAVATATAGLRGAGVAIPFSAYLSDGAVAGGRPYGNLLAAADMNGLPVIVTLFADRNGDGVIGPSGKDPRRDVRALQELEPVGTEVALFDGSGQASGTIMTTVGGPPSRGGVSLVATATAFTGAYDPAFLRGAVPTGPAITTAQPFLPERDPTRIFTDVGPLAVASTLNPRLRAAALPDPHGAVPLALGAKSGGPTTDTARAIAGPAVCARLMEPGKGRALPTEPPSLQLGTLGSVGRAKLVVVAVDRLGNPTDPPPGLTVHLVTDAPLAISPDADAAPASETVTVTKTAGAKVTVRALGAGSGVLRVLAGGALCQQLAVGARAERNGGASDAVVAIKGRADYRSLAAAATGAQDRNGDGRITITVGEGVFRETVAVTRTLDLIGAGSGRTIIDAQGVGSALTIGASGASISGLTASGGTTGVSVTVPTTVTGLEARGNVGAGIALDTNGAAAVACTARANGGPGVSLPATATATGNTAIDNAGAGIEATASAVAITGNLLMSNGGGGVLVRLVDAPHVEGNSVAGNTGEGITLEETTGGSVTHNRAAANDGDGLSLQKSDGTLVDGNDLTSNSGFGMRIDRATADFAAAPGPQDPPGSNDVSDNRKGAIDVR
jgi:parallel beta-helix repeat protein